MIGCVVQEKERMEQPRNRRLFFLLVRCLLSLSLFLLLGALRVPRLLPWRKGALSRQRVWETGRV